MADHLTLQTPDSSGLWTGSEVYDLGPQILNFDILLLLTTHYRR